MAKIPNIDCTGYANFVGFGLLDVTKYGAKGDNSTDNQTAIQAAVDACAQFGGGTVWFPPGIYRVGGPVTASPIVDLAGTPYASAIYLNHASANLFVTSLTANNSNHTRVSNLAFEGTVANTGNVFHSVTGSSWRWLFDNCSFNTNLTNLRGVLYKADAAADVTFRNCILNQKSTSTSAIFTSAPNGTLSMSGCTVSMPQNYTGTMLAMNGVRANIYNNTFDLTAHTAGANAHVMYFGDNVANKHHIVTGNEFPRNNGVALTAIGFDSGTTLVTAGNYFPHNVGLSLYGLGQALLGSELQMRPFTRTAIGTSVTLPDGYASVSVSSNQTAPNITMPTKAFPGQRLRVNLRNASGSGWDHNYFVGVSMATTIIGAGQDAYFEFEVSDVVSAGTYVWQIMNDAYS